MLYLQNLRQITVTAYIFFNDTATTEIYTLSLHDALPIWEGPGLGPIITPCTCIRRSLASPPTPLGFFPFLLLGALMTLDAVRSEEHTSELQSRPHLVCRLLLEKKRTVKHLVFLT